MTEHFNNVFYGITAMDIIDILLVAFLVYKVLEFIHKTGASQLLKGIGLLILAMILSDAFELHTVNWILKSVVALGAVAILIIFQPELRRALESMGRNQFFNSSSRMAKEKGKHIVSEIVSAVESFSRDRTGALIVFERQSSLNDIVEKSGTIVDAAITDQILGNIFYEGAPLHDGAVIIKDGRVHAAGCVLPLTGRQEFAKELGTRHRAGLGITEHSDALVLIVSEETGIISMAHDGELERFLDLKTVEKTLLGMFIKNEQKSASNSWFGKIFNGRGKRDVK
ncbi:MAG: diadenylate cyclase CdaA [Eubacterium sp.]|nr:diadenylate cyclase CdaA [Candidatus Colimonas fimequi]